MVLPNKYAVVAGIVLAAIAAAIGVLPLSQAWTVGLQAATILAGAFGVQQLSPAAISQKIPAHAAAIASAALTALNVFLQSDVGGMPTWLHAVIGAVFAVAAALGITVTGLQVSKAAKAAEHPRDAHTGRYV